MMRLALLGFLVIALVASVVVWPAPRAEAQDYAGNLRGGLYSLFKTSNANWLLGHDPTTGASYVATRLPRIYVKSIAFHDDQLYLAANTSNTSISKIYRVDGSGAIVAVSSQNFNAAGIASDGTTLYLAAYSTYGSVKEGIHSMDASGTLTEEFLSSSIPSGDITWHDGAIWGAGSTEVYKYDPSDSSFTQYTFETLGITATSTYGIASFDDNLYLSVSIGSTPATAFWDLTDITAPALLGSSSDSHGSMAGYGAPDLPTDGAYMVDSLDRLLWVDLEGEGEAFAEASIHAPALTDPKSLDVKGITMMNGVMYVLDETTPALYTVDRSSGAATRVGAATDFGVSETQPAGLTSRDGELYMLGGDNGALLRLSTITGEAAVALELRSSETSPTGLAEVAGSFYMVGDDLDRLHIIDEDTGRAYPVGDSSGFGVAEHQPTGLTVIDGELFVVGQDTDQLHQVSRFTGKAAKGRSSPDFEFDALAYSTSYFTDVQPQSVAAVAASPAPVADDDPPDVSFIPGQQATLSRAERAAMGVVNFGLVSSSVNAQDIASHNGVLYMLETSSRAIYRMEPGTGRATGGVALTGLGSVTLHALTSCNGRLYLGRNYRTSKGGTSYSYYGGVLSVDPISGVAVSVGSALSAYADALYCHNDVLHAITSTGQLYRHVDDTSRRETLCDFARTDIDGAASIAGAVYLAIGADIKTMNDDCTVEDAFTSGETAITGIAQHADGNVYLVGTGSDALYRVVSERRVGASWTDTGGYGVYPDPSRREVLAALYADPAPAAANQRLESLWWETDSESDERQLHLRVTDPSLDEVNPTAFQMTFTRRDDDAPFFTMRLDGQTVDEAPARSDDATTWTITADADQWPLSDTDWYSLIGEVIDVRFLPAPKVQLDDDLFSYQRPYITDITAEPDADDPDNLVDLAWRIFPPVVGAHYYQVRRNDDAVIDLPLEVSSFSDPGLDRAVGRVVYRARAVVSGDLLPNPVENDEGFTTSLRSGELRYSPWSLAATVLISDPGGELSPFGDPGSALLERTEATDSLASTYDAIAATMGFGDRGGSDVMLPIIAFVLASVAAAATMMLTSRGPTGGLSVTAGAFVFILVWMGLGPTMFGVSWALAAVPTSLVLLAAVFTFKRGAFA